MYNILQLTVLEHCLSIRLWTGNTSTFSHSRIVPFDLGNQSFLGLIIGIVWIQHKLNRQANNLIVLYVSIQILKIILATVDYRSNITNQPCHSRVSR